MADQFAGKLPLRHPAENPMFILMVILNLAIMGVLIDFLASAALIPPSLRGTNWEPTVRAVAAAILVVAPALVIVRQVQRVSGWRSPSCPGRTPGQYGASGGCTSSACSAPRTASAKRATPRKPCNTGTMTPWP